MPRGRRPAAGSAEERAALRRERVRLNVQAFRRRKAGTDGAPHDPNTLKLRWKSDSKWQVEYDELQKQSNALDDAHTEVGRSDRSESVADVKFTDDAVTKLPTMTLMQTPNLSRQYSQALLAMVPARFLPYRVRIPTVPNGFMSIRTPCALWVVSAVERAQLHDSGPLKDVLLSIVLAMASKDEKRSDLAMTSNTLYTRSLTKIRRSLEPILEQKMVPQGTDIVSVFLACHAASVFELMVNSSLVDMANHVLGVGFLIQHLQTRAEMIGINAVIGDSLIEEYRMLQMSFTLMHRRPSLLKKRVGNQEKDMGCSVFTDLLDLADQIPPIMVDIDQLRQKTQSQPSYCVGVLNHRIPELLRIHKRFSRWNDILKLKMLEGDPSQVLDPAQLNPNPSTLTSFELAATWMFSLSYDSYAVGTAIEACEFLESIDDGASEDKASLRLQIEALRNELLAEIGSIVEILPIFLQDDKGITGRSIAIWPLEGAWSALESEENRLRRDEERFERDDASLDLKIKVQEKKVKVLKYLKMCRDIVELAKSYGLPVFSQR